MSDFGAALVYIGAILVFCHRYGGNETGLVISLLMMFAGGAILAKTRRSWMHGTD